MGGCRRGVLAGEREWLLARIIERPDLTLRAIVAELAARDVRVSYDAVWRFYKRGDCQDFRVWTGIMGKKESHYVPTQRACDTE